MIDYVKLSLNSKRFAQSLLTNPHLAKSSTWTSHRTLAVKDIYTFRGLKFVIYRTGRIEIDGSLHKYFNGGRHNHNNFSFLNLKQVVFELSDLLGNELLNASVNNLEYGLNINPSFPAMKYINSLIVYHSKGITPKSPITRNDSKGFDKGIRFTLNQYEVKIYNKSQQYTEAEANLLRVEYKTRKMEIVKDLEIKQLADLLDRQKIAGLHDKLLKSVLNSISAEDINTRKLSTKERCELLESENPEFWLSLNSNYYIRKRLRNFQQLQECYAITKRKQEVIKLLNEKYGQLIL